MSGLQINFHKSAIMGINVEEQWLTAAANSLHCKKGSLPMTYLGLPIGGNTSRIKSWEPIITKMSKKLASWKGKLLSIGGRLTLIKASLSSLPIYYMSLFPIPRGVIAQITCLQRNFLWNNYEGKNPFPLVRWDLIQIPKALGGLNVSNLLYRNLGLLYKWIWRYFTEPNSLWRQVVQAKYGYSQSLSIADILTLPRGGPWKNVCNTLLSDPKVTALIKNGTRKSIGNGAKANTFFWLDSWLGDSPLKTAFPRLFRISLLPKAW